MAVNPEFKQFIEDQLQGFGEIQSKSMFGGVGFFKEGLMFAKIGGDVFRLKVDDINQPDFEARGMKPFFSESKKKGMPYWEVPADILEDADELHKWAQKAFEAALRAKK